MITIGITQIKYMIAEMVKAEKELVEARKLDDFEDKEQYIAFREGLYDGYLDVLFMLGYTTSEITDMELEEASKKGIKICN